MKKGKNLTENKVLINTFKKLKLKNYLNKSFLKKKSFFLFKYKGVYLSKVKQFFFKNGCFIRFGVFFQKFLHPGKIKTFLKKKKILKKILMFTNLYFY